MKEVPTINFVKGLKKLKEKIDLPVSLLISPTVIKNKDIFDEK